MPVALAVTGIVLAVSGGAISAFGQYQSGQAQKKMYDYQAAVATRQQEMAQQAADTNVKLTQFQASEDTAQLNKKYALVEGAQKATRAAQGVGGGSVTEGDIATDTFKNQTLDEMNIRYNADLKSWAIRNQAAGEIWGLETQKNQYTYAGKNAATAGAISSAGTIFSTAGSAAYNYGRLKMSQS